AAFCPELPERQGRMREAQLGDLAESWRELAQALGALEPTNRFELGMRGASRADEVRVICVREAVRTGLRRPDDRALLEGKRCVVRPCGGEDSRDPVDALRIGERLLSPGRDTELRPLGSCRSRDGPRS